MINLVQNAMQAMDGRGKITINTTTRRLARAWATMPASERTPIVQKPGKITAPRVSRPDDALTEFVEVSVRDTGPGISQKVLKTLFIPFVTTKEQGTGIMLAARAAD